MREHVLFHVNCVYGVGHYRRVELLVRALRRHRPDWLITVMTGGPSWAPFADVPGCRVVALPGIRYTSIETPDLIGVNGRPADEVLNDRRQIIEQALRGIPITAALFEFFPFSSQFLTDEIRNLVRVVRTHNRAAKFVTSVRDIQWNERMKAAPERWRATTETLMEELIDWIFVHSDPTFLPLDFCWGARPNFAAKVVHTGFVVEQCQPPFDEQGEGPVVCSVGGGKDGLPALRLFLQAWDLLRKRKALPGSAHGMIFAGQFCEGSERVSLLREYEHLFTNTAGKLQVGSWEQYRNVGPQASASVSMCGYNTCYEVLSWGVPAIFIPRIDLEQTTRARLLQERGWGRVARDEHQLAEALQVQWSRKAPTRFVPPLDLNGAAQTAHLLGDLVRE